MSPTIYSQMLKERLHPFAVLYVDDLTICVPSKKQCENDTVPFFKRLASCHKASLSKLQSVQHVNFLGHDISAEENKLSVDRISAIQKILKPVTKNMFFHF